MSLGLDHFYYLLKPWESFGPSLAHITWERLDKWLQKLHSIASIDSIDIPLGPHMSNEVQEVGLKVLTKIYEIKIVLEIIVWLPRFRRSQLECSCLFQVCLVPIVAAAECIHNPMLSFDTLMPGQTSPPIWQKDTWDPGPVADEPCTMVQEVVVVWALVAAMQCTWHGGQRLRIFNVE
jgi:hypothetical protein